MGKGDPVAPPPGEHEYDIRFHDRAAAVGWRELSKQAPGNTLAAWQEMRTNPAPKEPTSRHHQLRHDLAYANHGGQSFPQWQIEVTAGSRIWYLFDEARRTCWLKVYTGHPKATE